jgi:polar amino acid transport system substrate-binding protein
MYGIDWVEERHKDYYFEVLSMPLIPFGIGGRFIRRFFALGYFVAFAFVMVSTVVSCLAADQSLSAKDLTYITEQFPLYNFQKDGRLQGISVDLLEKAWERMGDSPNRSIIELLPWTEGYKRTLTERNTVLFSTARLPEREQLFKWAGPIGPFRNVLLVKRDKNISIANSEDLKKYKIGAIKDDSAVQMLLDKGMKMEDLVLKTSPKPLIEMLQNESIDAWAYGDAAGTWLIQDSGLNSSDYRTAYVLGQSDYYYAFNRETPDALVQSFQQALDSVKGNKDPQGVSDYEKIIAEYIPAML